MEEEKGSTTDEQATPKENLTSKLFADLMVEEETPPVVEPETKEVSETPEEENKETPPSPEYLDPQEFGEKKVKVKIDGVEMEVPFRDVVKGYQTDQYLTRKGQTIAEERKRVQEPPPAEEEYMDALAAKQIQELRAELERVKQYEAGVASELAPIRYERTMGSIDARMKQEGLTDFKDKLPEIEKILLAMPPEQMAAYDNPHGFEYVYKNLKLQDFKKAQVEKHKNPDERPKPKVVPIESSSSPSGVESVNTERTKAKEKAVQTGDWTEFFMKFG